MFSSSPVKRFLQGETSSKPTHSNSVHAWLFLACLKSREQREEREHHVADVNQQAHSYLHALGPGAALGYNLLAWSSSQSEDQEFDDEDRDDDSDDDDWDSDW